MRGKKGISLAKRDDVLSRVEEGINLDDDAWLQKSKLLRIGKYSSVLIIYCKSKKPFWKA